MDNKSYSKGISWFDDCRIPFVDEGDKWTIDRDKEVIVSNPQHSGREDVKWKREGLDNSNTQGRFPANLLVCDDMLNDGSTTKGSGHKIPKRTNNSKNVLDLKTYQRECAYEDKGTNSRYYNIDKWFDKIINE